VNDPSNLLVLGVTGQVGKRVATNLKMREANFSVGSRRKANLEDLADQFGASRFIDRDDSRTFDEALKNVTGVFLITGYTVDMLVQSKSLIDAAKPRNVFPYHSGRQASASTPSASPGSGQGRSRAFQLRPASSDLKRPRLLAA
jgi:uncharacterized protein YbjT (DUF2867 family)